MKILVIDDTLINQASARQTLGGHELTIVGDYDMAHELLAEPEADYRMVEAEKERRGLKYWQGMLQDEYEALEAATKKIKAELRPPPPFEVVLCDLLMPAGREAQGDKGSKYVGQEMLVGFALALMAVLQGAKYIAVVTATNHHDHPASAMLDRLSVYRWAESPQENPAKFIINGARVGFFHAVMVEGEKGGKDWGKVLSRLLEG